MISEDIKTCKHWKYETTDDPHFADVYVNLHNAVSIKVFRLGQNLPIKFKRAWRIQLVLRSFINTHLEL